MNRLALQMANLGSSTLQMRFALRSAAGTIFCSSVATALLADGVWRTSAFDLTATAMTNLAGSETLAQVLANAAELRLLSAATGPAFNGDSIVATLGVDNITATSIPVPAPAITEFTIAGGMPRISFRSVTGQTYRVEKESALQESNWVPLPNAISIAGTGGVIEVNDPEPNARSLSRRFYRVVRL